MHVFIDAYTEEDNVKSRELQDTNWHDIYCNLNELLEELTNSDGYEILDFEIWDAEEEAPNEPMEVITPEMIYIYFDFGLGNCRSIW